MKLAYFSSVDIKIVLRHVLEHNGKLLDSNSNVPTASYAAAPPVNSFVNTAVVDNHNSKQEKILRLNMFGF